VAGPWWSGLERPLARRAQRELRRSCARAGLRASGGVRSRPRSIGTSAGVGTGSGVARTGRVRPSARACSGMPGQVNTCVFSFALVQALDEQPNV
jgi:hypothetical protein